MHFVTRLLFPTVLASSLSLIAQQASPTDPSQLAPSTAPIATPSATPVITTNSTPSLNTNTPNSENSSKALTLPLTEHSPEHLPAASASLLISNTVAPAEPLSSPIPSKSNLAPVAESKPHLISTNALERLRAARAKFKDTQTALRPLLTKNIGDQAKIAPKPASIALPQASPTPNTPTVATTNPTPLAVNPNEKVSIQFPHTSILEVLSLYEKLTGKHIIRDSNLAGPELSIMVADPVTKQEAIKDIETSMLLNGYIVVPVDEKTIKILGPSRPPRTEGLPLYVEETELPVDDQLVSFYQPLHFLSPNEAITIVQGVVQLNPFGSLVAVPNTSAIVITDKTPLIRKALALLKIIDHESSQIITEFIPLQRADAEKTVATLNQIFGKENSSTPGTPPTNPAVPNTPNSQGTVQTSTPGDERVFSGKVQFIADKRTNRILVVTRAENYRYVRELIAKLDQAQQVEQPLVRPLNYMSANDVFPVLVDMLKNKDDENTQNQAKGQPTPQNAFKNSGSGGLGGSQNPMDSSSSVNAGGNHGDRLNEAAQQSPPQSAIIGATSVVADPTANSIMVYGPPESKAKAAQIMDLLDRRPQQVYLAAVIGEMTLSEGMDYGASYLFHYQGFNTLANTIGGPAASALLNSVNSAFPLIGATNGLTTSHAVGVNTINNVVNNPAQGGLTLFGSIGGSVDMYANFLESTGKFKTISRPVVYTSNNKKATILSGRRIPYQSSSLSSVVASGGTVNTNQTANSITANVTYQDVLLKLEVIPLINSDKEVNLIIAQQNQSVNDAETKVAVASGVNAPVVNTQELTTSVRIPSGSTIVLGGLISDEKLNDERGIPYVNKIPIIGPLLGGRTTKNKVRRELVVMIQPVVVDSNTSIERASDKEGGSSELGKQAKDLRNKLMPTPSPTPDKKKFKLFRLPKQKNF